MYSYFFDDLMDFFHARLSEEDTQAYRNIKTKLKIQWNRARKIRNYVTVAALIMITGATLLIYGFEFDRLAIYFWFAFSIFVYNNVEPDDEEAWALFLDTHLENNSILENYQSLSNQQRNYLRARYYILQKTKLAPIDFQMLIDQMNSNQKFRNEKARQHRYDRYHYLAVIEEMKITSLDDYKTLFRSKILFKRLIIGWSIFGFAILLVMIFLVYAEYWTIYVGIVAGLFLVWLIILPFLLLIWILYPNSKYSLIRKWERFFTEKGWETFERQNYWFSDFAVLDKYATYFLEKNVV